MGLVVVGPLLDSIRVHDDHVHDYLGRVIHFFHTLVDAADHVDVPAAREAVHEILALELCKRKNHGNSCRGDNRSWILPRVHFVGVHHHSATSLNVDSPKNEISVKRVVELLENTSDKLL